MNHHLSVDEVLAAALALTNASARSAYLDRVCAGNLTLRQEVETRHRSHRDHEERKAKKRGYECSVAKQ